MTILVSQYLPVAAARAATWVVTTEKKEKPGGQRTVVSEELTAMPAPKSQMEPQF